MKHRLPVLIESDTLPVKTVLAPPRIRQRWAIAALHMAGIAKRAIGIFTQVHTSTVHRWIGRVEEGYAITDRPRSGRPRIYGEAARLTTIAVYCQQAPPLPGVHRWSLRNAECRLSWYIPQLGEILPR
jgi:transposase